MTNRLREVRETRGLKQRELAEATHTCQTIISEFERGVRKPWLKVAKKLSRALGITIQELFPNDFNGEG